MLNRDLEAEIWFRNFYIVKVRLYEEINSRRWIAKLWSRGSFCIIFLSIFMGTLLPGLVWNPVLYKYIQYVLVTLSGLLWIRYVWTIVDGPEGVPHPGMVEKVDTGGLKPPAL